MKITTDVVETVTISKRSTEQLYHHKQLKYQMIMNSDFNINNA